MRRFLLTGHVDHGKSTLGGQLLYQCGAVGERELKKTFDQAEQDQMYSFRYARLLDIDSEEQDRGVTIESNEIEFSYKGDKFKLIDTPGHKLYIRYLIEAIYRNCSDGIADDNNVVGVLVLSAVRRELEAAISSGQVKEDILLLRAIGINFLVVAVNKLDKFNMPSDASSAFKAAKSSLTPILKLAKFKHVEYAACSGLEGAGIITPNPIFPHIPSLIDSISKLSSESNLSLPSVHLRNSASVNKFTAEIFILNCDIFTAGYTGTLHSTKGEYTFTIETLNKITTSNTRARQLPFIKTGDKGVVTIVLAEHVCLNNRDRIILRSRDSTIAYGIVLLNQ